MRTSLYLQRLLSCEDKTYSETELLIASKYIVILAEPGGGKTDLMNSLAQQLNASVITASKFSYTTAKEINIPLIIDAFDELAKIDDAAIFKILGKATDINPSHVIISSRSSEWNNATTYAFKDFFGHTPLVMRLQEFTESEQKLIFENHAPDEVFETFQAEVQRFDLDALLPNPQFLKLFADAYIESGKYFTDKRSIFSQAVEHLAREANSNIKSIGHGPSTTQKADLASKAFAILVLSGAEGVSTNEAFEDRMYPLLASLYEDSSVADSILATRLFRPGDTASQHRPIHKIVSEYCAARYLTKRISNPRDPLTLANCLPIIAPNLTVRDELRGLLGWMASLGNKPIEMASIELDPYAILANGDPSQLEPSSRKHLVSKLKDVEDIDPYFRRGDFWRKLSVAGFFTKDVIDEIRPLLTDTTEGHLRDLILELLKGSPIIAQLSGELRQLILSPTSSANTRLLANSCLLELTKYDHKADIAVLIFEASQTSLNVVAKTIETLGLKTFHRQYLSNFLRVCASLYPGHQSRLSRTIGSRYFVKRFIGKMDLTTTEWLLDDLTRTLSCTCSKKSYECDCRNGISKIVGSLLDQYFEMASPPYDPRRVWQWLRNLNFHGHGGRKESTAVQVLRKNHELRQSIIALVFRDLTDRDQIFKAKIYQFDLYSHAGLQFQQDDYKFIVNLAFDINNPALWASFMARHHNHQKMTDRGPNALRRHMREQARAEPVFMREWVKVNQEEARHKRENQMQSFRHNRKMKRHRKIKNEIRSENIKYVDKNRELIEGGRHWNCLVRFAELVLMAPEKIEREFGDENLVRNALKNCLGFIDEHVPDLQRLAELQCTSQSLYSENILYAACLEILRDQGNLESVDRRLLKALRTNINMGYSAVSEEEQNRLKTEVERLIFPDNASAEEFIRQYLEPQLATYECINSEIWWIQNEEVFVPFRAKISIEWLKRFRSLKLSSLDTLFELATQFGNHEELKGIIAERCAEFIFFWPNPTGNEVIEQKRAFWFVRAFYFLRDAPEIYWDWLKSNKETVLMFHALSGHLNRNEHPKWPKLTSEKVESILEAFVEQWPKVPLPNSYGTDAPDEENAYRFLTEVVWLINADAPDDAIPVLDRLITDVRFVDFLNDLKSIRANQVRKKALRDFEPPTPQEIVNLLDHDSVVTVESLRQRVIQELKDFQKVIDGGEYNLANRFYEKDERLDEVRSTEIIAERLNLKLEPQSISVTPEHQLKAAKRSDFTVTKMISGRRKLLVAEVKGQWHKDLYTAASAQLYERYSIHPDAEQQGIFLVIWFGEDEKVAGSKKHGIGNAQELQESIEKALPTELKGLIDVFVLDVSKQNDDYSKHHGS